jgi:hypothetical protein
MLRPPRTAEYRLRALVRPPLQLGDRDEAELAPPNQPQLRLDVALERTSDIPSDNAASWRLSATRGTLLDAVLTTTTV